MAQLTEEELAMLTEEERAGYLEDDEDDGDDDNNDAGDSADNDSADDDSADDGAEPGDDDKEPPAVDDAASDDAQQQDDNSASEAQANQAENNTAFTPQPKPLFNADLPADIESQRTALDSKEDSLDKQYDEGDITFTEHKKAMREINRERSSLDRAELKAELAAESQQSQIDQNWQNAQASFFASHPELNPENSAQMAALDSLVRQETKAVMDKGGAVGIPELERAYAKYKQTFGIPDTAQTQAKQQEQKPAAKTKKANAVPPNLGKLPAAAGNDTDDGKFAHLDRLADSDPLAFEEALSKMSDSQREEYMQAG